DLRGEKVQRKIAESEQKKIPYALVVGRREAEAGQVALREHGVGDKGVMSLDEALALFAGHHVE
ncbi:MAG: His/Gly/Thr/Pro-type tRNA ligase C-terminal domain-containing protein, partial [Candidatus Kapaibacterium sp.]